MYERNESNRQQTLRYQLTPGAEEKPEILMVLSQGENHLSPVSDLIPKGSRYVFCGCGSQDGIERSLFGPAQPAVSNGKLDVLVTQSTKQKACS